MNRLISIGLVVSIFLLVLTSCSSGIPQTQYDKATADLQALQSQYDSLKTSNQTSAQSFQADIAKKQTEVDAAKKQIADLSSQVDSANSKSQKLEALLSLGPNSASSKEAVLAAPEKYASTFYPASSETLISQYASDALDKVKVVFGMAKDGTLSPNKDYSDQYDNAIFLWDTLNAKHVNSIIILGNLKDEKASFENSKDIWFRIYGPDPKNLKYYVIDANTLSFINFTNADDKPIAENAVYKDNWGFWYANSKDFKKDIAYRWK